SLCTVTTNRLYELLRECQHERSHIAIVVDEHGATEALIILDDILEEIVGDIADEYDDTEEKLYTRFRSGVYIFDAKIDLDDMEDLLDCELTSDDDDLETLGGLVYHLTERLRSVGERVYYRDIEFTIHSVLKYRVRKVRVKVQGDKSQTRQPASKLKTSICTSQMPQSGEELVQHNVELRPFNTMDIAARAPSFATVGSVSELHRILDFATV